MPTLSALHPPSTSVAVALAAFLFAFLYCASVWVRRRKGALRPWRHHATVGGAVTFILLEVACVAAAREDWLEQVLAALLGLSLTVGFAGLCVGYVFLTRLAGESLEELRGREEASPLEGLIQLAARLLAIALFMAAMVALFDYLPYPYDWFARKFVWLLIAAAFYQLWISRSLASKLLRALLLLLFAAVLVGGTAGFFHLLYSYISPWLFVPLAAAVSVNVVFYFHLRALPEAKPETVAYLG